MQLVFLISSITAAFFANFHSIQSLEEGTAVKTFSLTVTVKEVSDTSGMMEFGLYNNAKVFTQVGKTFKKIRTRIDSDSVTVTFTGLPEGSYAVCIYHDANNNDECDKNFFGVPTEGYGFSNNIRPTISVPAFSECSFYLKEDKHITISPIY
jgi:uncharacterized protein (DUF2141 family)